MIIDPSCAAVTCPVNWPCVDGQCIRPTPFCQNNQDCLPYEFCLSGACVDRCALIRCQAGYICQMGNCIPTCQLINCSPGYTCIDGKCVPIQQGCINDSQCSPSYRCHLDYCVPRCPIISCPSGNQCINGECVPILNICPATSAIPYRSCIYPRPTYETCPQIYYFRAPDPNYCGVKANGERVDFAMECEACRDTSI